MTTITERRCPICGFTDQLHVDGYVRHPMPPPPESDPGGPRPLPIPSWRCRWFGHALVMQTAGPWRLLRCGRCGIVIGDWKSG